MLAGASRRTHMGVAYLLRWKASDALSPASATRTAAKLYRFKSCRASNFILEELEDAPESVDQMKETKVPMMSLAKSLACLTDESFAGAGKRRPLTRMELKRLIELRIKKRVKAQYSDGKYHDLMSKVIANADTLQDSYDIVRLNSNVKLESKKDDICFASLAEQLASGEFDVEPNTLSMYAKSKQKESLVLPKLKLRIIQEAIRVVLEIVYRPHFSKLSHGCRSGRGRRSALNYIGKEVGKHDWWFTITVNKAADRNIICKLISDMEERIEDSTLFSFISRMFDANVLNLVFGGFTKGHGLPQEGILSPVLMNIYLDSFDKEVFRICMNHEAFGSQFGDAKDAQTSKLRCWIRRQIKESDDKSIKDRNDGVITGLCACRYMDEIFVAVSGSKDTAMTIKTHMTSYLNNSLYLDVEHWTDLSAVQKKYCGIQFAGTVIRVAAKGSPALKAVHKLKDKVRLFASQKQEIWDAMTLRIGKKWLAYGLRRIKESEIKQLGLSTPLLDHVSQFRKEGMKTDHWYKSLLKIWMQDVNAKHVSHEEALLSKYITEPALPQDLIDSFYNFQKQAQEYVSSETAATLELLYSSPTCSNPSAQETVTRLEAPINFIKKCLHRYGLINSEGFPIHVAKLVLQDDDLIISWFSGLVQRWLKWYSECENFREIKLLIVDNVRKSCIRTLAAKYRVHEGLIEKKFDLDQSGIPMTEDLESENSALSSDSSILDNDEALMYGTSGSGLCMLSLSRVKVPTRVFNCFIVGCTVTSPSMYILHVKERQRFPGWQTGFSTSIHPSLNGRRIGLCSQHIKDLYLGHISLQCIEFGVLSC